MFYKMIENARNRWYASPECTITSLIDYIESKGMLRDAQIDAIKTYLFLKVYCESKPIADLFYEGKFNTLNLDNAEISIMVDFLRMHFMAFLIQTTFLVCLWGLVRRI